MGVEEVGAGGWGLVPSQRDSNAEIASMSNVFMT